MKVRLQWLMQNQNSDHGLVAEETWRAIARVASLFQVKPEDVASAWLDGVLHEHRSYTIHGGQVARLETVKLSAGIWDALDRLRSREAPKATISEFLEQIFHERFFPTDFVYADAWMAAERRRFERECLATERKRLAALQEARKK